MISSHERGEDGDTPLVPQSILTQIMTNARLGCRMCYLGALFADSFGKFRRQQIDE
jgi:hypothetical protein